MRLYRESENGGPVERLMLPCKRRVCGFCGPHHWRPRVLAGLHAGLDDDRQGEYLAVLLTAPGDADSSWNDGASKRWNHFVTILRREFPVATLDYWRVAELQARGLVHFHFVLRGLRFLPVETLRRLAVTAGFGSFVGVRSPKDYPGGVRSAGFYFGKYLLKAYDARIGLTKLVTMSRSWRTRWVTPERAPGRGGWLFAGPSHAGWRLLGFEASVPRGAGAPRPAIPPWHRQAWQWVRAREARPDSFLIDTPLQGRLGSARRRPSRYPGRRRF